MMYWSKGLNSVTGVVNDEGLRLYYVYQQIDTSQCIDCMYLRLLKRSWGGNTDGYAMEMKSFMMTSSNGNIFGVTGSLCGEFTGHRWIPLTKASDAEIWFFFDLHLNKRLNKQSWGWWFGTPSLPLWRHCNVRVTPHRRLIVYEIV